MIQGITPRLCYKCPSLKSSPKKNPAKALGHIIIYIYIYMSITRRIKERNGMGSAAEYTICSESGLPAHMDRFAATHILLLPKSEWCCRPATSPNLRNPTALLPLQKKHLFRAQSKWCAAYQGQAASLPCRKDYATLTFAHTTNTHTHIPCVHRTLRFAFSSSGSVNGTRSYQRVGSKEGLLCAYERAKGRETAFRQRRR